MPRKQRFKPSRKPKPAIDPTLPPQTIEVPPAPNDGGARASEPDRGDPGPSSLQPAPDLPDHQREEAAAS